MAHLIYRSTSADPGRSASSVKNSPLTNAELDGNFKVLDAALSSGALLDSPAFSGIPTAPTATAGTNTTQLATTAFVQTALGGGSGGGATLVNDTSTDITQYIGMSRITSGAWITGYTAPTKLYFNPNTGILSSTQFNSLSDANLKENIEPIYNSVNIIKQLNGVEFVWKESGNKSSGVIAQELEKVLPHLVSEDKGVKSVNYTGIIGYLIESIKELESRISILENK